MRGCFNRPPAFELVAGYGSSIHHRRAAVRQCVVGAAIVTHRSFIPLSNTVEPSGIFVVIFPYPPPVVGPFVADVAVSVAENNQAGRLLDARIAADIVLVP